MPTLEAKRPERALWPLPDLSAHARADAHRGAHTRYAQSSGDVLETFPSQEAEKVLGQCGQQRRAQAHRLQRHPPKGNAHPLAAAASTAITWSHAADACPTSQASHGSHSSLSQLSTSTSSGSFCIQTPRFQPGSSIDWGSSQNAGPLATRKDGVSLEQQQQQHSCNNSIDMLPATPNDQATFPGFIMPKHGLSAPMYDLSSKQSHQLRNLSRLTCEPVAISEGEDDDGISRSSTPLSPPPLFGNFTMDIHPELRRNSLLLSLDIEPKNETTSPIPAPVPVRPNSFRRSKSTGTTHRAKVAENSAKPRVPALPRIPPHGASFAHRPPLTPRPPTPPRRAHTRSSSDVTHSEGELASMTGAASVAVRRRVRSSPKSATVSSFGARLDNNHRRAASHGGERMLGFGRSAPSPLSTSQPPHGLSPASKTPIAFVISRRAPPPPPIAVPPKRLRSPPPPRRSALASPRPPPTSTPRLPGPAPTRALPAAPGSNAPAFPQVAQEVTPSSGAPAGLAPLTIPPAASTPISPVISPLTPWSPLSPMRSPALGPDSAYARFRARSRAKSISASRPTIFEPDVTPPAAVLETLAETIAAIKEAETWEWPVPPYVLRAPVPESRRPSASSAPATMEENVEELNNTLVSPAVADRALHEPLPPLPMPAPIAFPMPIAQGPRMSKMPGAHPRGPRPPRPPRSLSRDSHIPPPAPAPVYRRGSESDHSLEGGHSASSFASELGPRTPDDYDNPFEHPGLQLMRHPFAMVKSPSAPALAAAAAATPSSPVATAPTSYHYHTREPAEYAPSSRPTRPRTASARPRFGVPF